MKHLKSSVDAVQVVGLWKTASEWEEPALSSGCSGYCVASNIIDSLLHPLAFQRIVSGLCRMLLELTDSWDDFRRLKSMVQ